MKLEAPPTLPRAWLGPQVPLQESRSLAVLPLPSERLDDVLSIYRTKSRYFRFLEEWALWRELLTDDLVFYEDVDSPVPKLTKPTADGADEFVEMVSEILRTTVTTHHGHMPEIDFVSDNEAHVVWAMFDYVDDPDNRNLAYHGYGHYYETYRCCEDGAGASQSSG
jgi:hypothetical protein